MNRHLLGGFEHRVLLAVVRLQGEAYSVSIVQELEGRTGRTVSAAAVYMAVKRLEEKGLLTSTVSLASPEEGGRSRRYYRVTPDGRASLEEARKDFLSLWEGVELDVGGQGS